MTSLRCKNKVVPNLRAFMLLSKRMFTMSAMTMIASIHFCFKKNTCALLFAALVLLLIAYHASNFHIVNYKIVINVDEGNPDDTLLKLNPKCKIPNLDPFNPEVKKYYEPREYFSCAKDGLLTFVTKINHTAVLYVDKKNALRFKKRVVCCYSVVERTSNGSKYDDEITISKCKVFRKKAVLRPDVEVVSVRCSLSRSFEHLIYSNVHSIVQVRKDIAKKLGEMDEKAKPFGVLLIGIDSVSRLNMIRTLPKTHKYLQERNWISMLGFNKIEQNTFPNIMAMMAGYNISRAMEMCDPLNQYMSCPLIWDHYRNLGYVTGYSEDEVEYSTFNYMKNGFEEPPVDCYFRPYMIASEQLLDIVRLDNSVFCTGPESSGERIMNNAKDFVKTFRDAPMFGLFWMNSFSHNHIMGPTRMDGKVREFLEDIENYGVMKNTFVIMLSDHGARFGDIRFTATGWLEDRLPYMFISVPDRFKRDFPTEYFNIREASNKLISPYDIYMTLQHILVLSKFDYKMTPSETCPSCQSLFTNINYSRSCEEAAIDQQWCTCGPYNAVSVKNRAVKEVTAFVLRYIQNELTRGEATDICVAFKLSRIMSASISPSTFYKSKVYYMVTFVTKPKAIFEAMVSYAKDPVTQRSVFELSGSINRLDLYGETSWCLLYDPRLRSFCYCKDNRY